MRSFVIIIFSLIVFAFTACNSENIEPVHMPEELYAIWVDNGYNDGISIFKKSNKFDEDKYGFQFVSDGKFIERKNSGFCGTPPISYANYEGIWSKVSDSLISVESQYWGGTIFFQLEVISINENELQVRYSYEN